MRLCGRLGQWCADVGLDTFDRQILDLVQRDSGRTAEDLAGEVALSPSAIQRRIRRLKDAGVILREMAVIDPAKVGRPTTFVVGVQIEKERPELLLALRRWLGRESGVQQAFYVTGEVDFVLIITTPDMESFDVLMQRMLEENPNVRRFVTNVTMSIIKQGLVIPIAGA